ncbi:thioredoxin X, chloroplastic [Prosopis cineraria]|uniref:thioredoxin X, chloroplastic n=1 Tax=Prosopis cineraria TaxID=364024 RepID=UPI00240F0046|nr:thioredoxin X, chloroplastic [Prosopis cineraria]
MACSPSLSNKPPLFTLRTLTSTSVSFPPSSVKISFASYPCRRTSLRLPNSSTVSQFRLTCASGIAEVNETQFSDTVLKADRPVLVEFVANWCGPCRLISPIMEWVAQEYGDRLTVVKIDHDANPKLIEEFKVYGLPTLVLFKNGQEVPESRREGAITKVKLKEHLDALLKSISVT